MDKRINASPKNWEHYADTMDIDQKKQIKTSFLNEESEVFKSPLSKGINTEDSLFDERAIFRTKEKKYEDR